MGSIAGEREIAGPAIAAGARRANRTPKYNNAAMVVSATASPHVHFIRPGKTKDEKR